MKHKKTFRSLTDALMLLTLLSIPAVMVIPRHVRALPHSERSDETSNVQPDRAPSKLYKVTDAAVNESDASGPYMQQFPRNPFIDKEYRGQAGGRSEGSSYEPATGVTRANTAGHEGL